MQTSSRSVVKLRRRDEGIVGFVQPALITPRLSSQSCDADNVQHEGQSMTNSTPNLVAWLAEYRKYLMLVADGATDEAALLKQEVEEGLNWVELSWADLEFANDSDQ